MGLFGKSKEDTSQDAQIQQLQTDISNCWAWIQQHEKNMQILIKNNDYFIKTIGQLKVKDQQHDAKDVEIETMIQGIKNMAKAIETVEVTSSVT